MARLVKRPALADILAFCAEDPIERVFLADVARRGLGRFAAVREDGRLRALCHLGANLVPSGVGAAELAAPATRSTPRMIVGAEGPVTELWKAIRSYLPEPLDDRPGQPVYVLEEPPPPGESGLRPAESRDLDLLVPACAAAFLEEVGVDAAARDRALFEWRTRTQIEEERSWLWEEDGRILFKAEASAWTEDAVQLQQVWVDPALRGRGYARRGLADLCALLLESTPAVCLFVRPENEPALRLYEGIGMRRAGSSRSLIFG
ncbi:MAG TPA: GNAT family N-acetyltransferase [Candidatus Limnocylindrales bacterium]|nr:GNAT family N-acetyltransferase [Candidatus Limnocylindrales bacterium]